MSITEVVFKDKTIIWENLVSFGFIEDNDKYTYQTSIISEQFEMIVYIYKNGEIKYQLIDKDTKDEYTLHLAEEAVGRFVGKVRLEVAQVLQEITDKCCKTQIFKSILANQIINYIHEKYHDELEFLWPKFPDNAVVRRKDNKKWYMVLLTVTSSKIGLDGDEKVEIIDIRMSPKDIEKLQDRKKYHLGYHMNKKHWVTICLDGSVPFTEICAKIDESYCLAKK